MGFLFSKNSKEKIRFESFYLGNEEKNKELGLKIHICGNNERKTEIVNTLFNKEKISDKRYINRAEREFKTEQFYWIAKLYKEDLTDKTINDIMDDIIKDRDERQPGIKQQIILCFIDENNKNKLSSFNGIKNDLYAPLIIIVSDNKIEPFGIIDKRRITNIVYRNMGNETLRSRIISALWNCDCYYNEKGNKVCRYTPDNIFKSLETTLSFQSINILLTGKSRAGKSTFINFLSNKLVALESSDRVSVTNTLNEYYIYSNKDGKSEQAAIKLIDTPGIVQNNIEKSKVFLKNLFNNPEKSMEKQIHFILFFFMEGDSFEGIDPIFKLLNECKIPVLFIINKAFDDTDGGNTKDIASTISFLSRLDCKNLINRDNYIGINLVKAKKIECFGVEDIFLRLIDIYKEKNKFSIDMEKHIKECVRNYNSEMVKNSEMINNNLSKEIIKMKAELEKEIHMFKCLDIDSIIKRGMKPAIICKNVINSLSNITHTMQIEGTEIPAISFFQAFMVKEIGEIFGFDTKNMNYGVKTYLNKIKKEFEKEEISFQTLKKEDIIKTINLNTEIIESQIQKELDKPNKDFIMTLLKLFMEFRKKYKENNKELSENEINRNMTDGICFTCINYLEDQLKKTNGFIFWNYYYEICKQILEDFEFYSKMDSSKWVKKEMIIIEK